MGLSNGLVEGVIYVVRHIKGLSKSKYLEVILYV